MADPIPEHDAKRASPIFELPAAQARGSARQQDFQARVSAREQGRQLSDEQERERDRRARRLGNTTADLCATLALPFFVLGLVVSRLALTVAGRRRRDKPYIGARYDAYSSDPD